MGWEPKILIKNSLRIMFALRRKNLSNKRKKNLNVKFSYKINSASHEMTEQLPTKPARPQKT